MLVMALFLGVAAWTCGQSSFRGGKSTGNKGNGGKETGKKDPKKDSETPAKPLTVDKLKLPDGAILVLVEEVKEILGMVPKMILLSPKEFQALMDEIQTLKAKVKREQEVPYSCKLSGEVKGDFAYLRAEFGIAVEAAKTPVFLGLKGANLTDEGELDGQPPVLESGPEGFTVRVDKKGTQVLVLKLKVPVGVRRSATSGGERGFELGLPGAAVTTLALELPGAVKEVRWNDHVEKLQPASRRGRWELALGSPRSLALSWKEPVAFSGPAPLLKADAAIAVKVDETQIVTTAELGLEDVLGQVKEWQLLLPPQARVEIKAPAGVQAEVVPPGPKEPFHVIRLKEPASERLPVVVQVNQKRAGPVRFPVGPYTVLGAHQTGTITVRPSPQALRGYRPLYHRHGEVYQKEAPSSPRGSTMAMFHYEHGPRKGPSGKWVPLEIELKAEKGQAQTQVEHTVRLSPAPSSGRRPEAGGAWQVEVTTKIQVKALSGSVDYLDVQLPRCRPEGLAAVAASPLGFPGSLSWGGLYLGARRNWPVAVPADFFCQGEGVVPELKTADALRRVRIAVSRPEAKEFTVVLTGKYGLPRYDTAEGPWEAALELPRPIGVLDRGGRITVIVDDSLELLQGAQDEPLPGGHRRTSSFEQTPVLAHLSWRPFRPEFPVAAVADVTIQGRNAHVRQQLRFLFPLRPSSQAAKPEQTPVFIRVPAAVRGVPRVEPEGRLRWEADKRLAWILPPDDAAKSEPIRLEYDFSVPAVQEAPAFAVPLLWPERATRIDAKVRVWCDPGVAPALAGDLQGPWQDRGTEVVAERDSLPALVLQGTGVVLPLRLRLHEPGQSETAAVIFDRGLIQVILEADGSHYYRARFLIRKLNARNLDIELPPAASVQSVKLDNHTLHYQLLEGDRTGLRLTVDPELFSNPVILDLEYKMAGVDEPLWQSTIHPPHFHNDAIVGRLRWQVTVPAGQVAIGLGSKTQAEFHWGVRDWLLSPEPGATAEELERWLGGSGPPGPFPAPSLIFWRTSLEPFGVWRVPRQAWFLICSGLVLAVGLGLAFIPLARYSRWLLLLLVGLMVITAGLMWPQLLAPVVYGCQPGLLVLLVVLSLHWLVQERYRRQVVFMPGFTRMQSNSSLLRAGQGNRPREPSTVDSPAAPPAGGSGS
jgi:hypothetical protein